MSEEEVTENYLRVTVDLIVEVTEVNALQAAALADLRVREDLDAEERREQIDQVNVDPSGAAALRWLISPDDVLALVGNIDEVAPLEAVLEISESDGELEFTEG